MSPSNDTPARIIHLWMEITRLLRKTMLKRAKRETTMNPMQMHAMVVIADHPNMTMKEFADQLHISSPSATSFVDRLVKLKWVARHADSTNRKLVRLQLQPQGQDALVQGMKEHSAVTHELFSLLASHDQEQLEHVLLHLKEALAQHVSHP